MREDEIFFFNMAAMEAHVLHVGIRRFYTLCIIVLGQLRHDHVTQTGVRDYVDALMKHANNVAISSYIIAVCILRIRLKSNVDFIRIQSHENDEKLKSRLLFQKIILAIFLYINYIDGIPSLTHPRKNWPIECTLFFC